jgi:hypothetical protein
VLSNRHPRKYVVTSGYEGALYVQCGRDDHIRYTLRYSVYYAGLFQGTECIVQVDCFEYQQLEVTGSRVTRFRGTRFEG